MNYFNQPVSTLQTMLREAQERLRKEEQNVSIITQAISVAKAREAAALQPAASA